MTEIYIAMLVGVVIFVLGVLLGAGVSLIVRDSKFKAGEWIKRKPGG